MAVLDEALARLKEGLPASALIVGDSGLGKTRLLDEAIVRSERLGIRVYRARADALSPNEALGLVLAALPRPPEERPPISTAIDRLITALEKSGSQAAIEAFLDVIDAAATKGPVLIALDDLQWADPSSLAAIRSAIRRLSTIPVGIVGTARSTRNADVETLRGSIEGAGGPIVRLSPLDRDAILELARARIGISPGQSLTRRLESTAGNPLWVCELLDALAAEGLIQEKGGVAEAEGSGLPGSLQTTILARLSFLSRSTLQMLKTASLFGGAFTVEELAAVSGQKMRSLLPGLEEAMEAAVLVEDGERLSFRHNLIREAIYQEIPQSIRRPLHREAAGALAHIGAPASRVTSHLVLGATPGDEEAIHWLWDAAKRARSTHPADAAEYLRRANALATPDFPQRIELVVDLVEALTFGGYAEEAEAVAESALPLVRDEDALVELTTLLGHAKWLLIKRDGAIAAFDRALRRIRHDDERKTRLMAQAAFVQVSTEDHAKAVALAKKAIELAEDDHATKGLSLVVLGADAFLSRRFTEALGHYSEAVAITERWRPPELVRRAPHMYLAIALNENDRFDESLSSIRASSAYEQEFASHVAWYEPARHVHAGQRLFYLGEWDDAAAEFTTALTLAEDIDRVVSSDAAHALLGLIAHDRGDDSLAKVHVDALQPMLGIWNQAPDILVSSTSHPDIVLKLLRSLDDFERTSPICNHIFFPRLIRFASSCGEAKEVRHLVEYMEETARLSPLPTRKAAAVHARAVMEGDLEGLLLAADLYSETPRVTERAGAFHDAAVAAAQARRAKQAKELAAVAGAIYARLGATRLSQSLAKGLAGAGMQGPSQSRRDRPSWGWGSLTKTEARVIEYVAKGLTNREIAEELVLSRRTIETHVAHILQKLELRSRAQLVAAAARRMDEFMQP